MTNSIKFVAQVDGMYKAYTFNTCIDEHRLITTMAALHTIKADVVLTPMIGYDKDNKITQEFGNSLVFTNMTKTAFITLLATEHDTVINTINSMPIIHIEVSYDNAPIANTSTDTNVNPIVKGNGDTMTNKTTNTTNNETKYTVEEWAKVVTEQAEQFVNDNGSQATIDALNSATEDNILDRLERAVNVTEQSSGIMFNMKKTFSNMMLYIKLKAKHLVSIIKSFALYVWEKIKAVGRAILDFTINSAAIIYDYTIATIIDVDKQLKTDIVDPLSKTSI